MRDLHCEAKHWLLGALLFCALPLHAQTCQTGTIEASAPDSRYTDNHDGTVTDSRTGLMWKQCSEGLITTSTPCDTTDPDAAPTYTWQGALQRAQTVRANGFAGHNDWRLPNPKELQSLVDQQCLSPAINVSYFPNTESAEYWSSSPYAGLSNYAWGVHFSDGDVNNGNKDLAYYVRLVRGGQ